MEGISEYTNSVFEQPWWLDVVAEGKWEEIILKDENKIKARWSYVKEREKILMPKLTQSLGFWIAKDIILQDHSFEERKKIIEELLGRLPAAKNVKISLDSNNNYFLPFYWKHYDISPKISYRLNDLSNIDLVYNRFSSVVKKNIKAAQKKVVIKEIDDIEILYHLISKTFEIQNRQNPISKELIKRIYDAAKINNAGKLLYAIDDLGQVYSGAFFVYDSRRCYYLLAGTDPLYRSSGANTLVIWEGIKFASKVSKEFDFEGSMIEGIERFFRKFGGVPVVRYSIRKQNLFWDIYQLIKPRIKSMIGYKQ